MKIQSLAVIFVIIIVPISLILSEFTQTQIKNVSIQSSYDSALLTATYDAVKAYQINGFNNSSGDITTSKIRDIEASANTFLNSIKSNFKLSGNSSIAINDYIPAIVYTMYDGYYIYSPYNNDIRNVYKETPGADTSNPNWSPTWATYRNGETIDGIKPYINYSCRYHKNDNYDFVITYSLDNYITIQGYVNGNYWDKSGYFLNKVSESGGTYYYNGVPIKGNEGTLEEWVYNPNETNPYTGENGYITKYPYIRINGTKYYYDSEYEEHVAKGINSQKGGIFFIQNDERNYSQVIEMGSYNNLDDNKNTILGYKWQMDNNNSAYKFYKEALAFTNEVKANLSGLLFTDAVDEEEHGIDISGFNEAGRNIFGGSKDAEDEDSNFSIHRTAVIRYTIEKNLTMAIANYDEKFGGDAAFSMPNLSEEDWYKLINETSVITFLQGLPMGTRIYNGYAVVTNNKNKNVVTDYSIYISDGNEYHRVDENDLNVAGSAKGYLNIDFEKVTQDGVNYYYPREELGSYTSIVNQTNVAKIGTVDALGNKRSLYDYLKESGKENLASVYYTALGRERYGMSRSGLGITEY